MIRDDPTDPADSSPEARTTELATIFAGAIVHLHKRAALTATVSPQTPLPESEEIQLDDGAKTRLHGQRG